MVHRSLNHSGPFWKWRWSGTCSNGVHVVHGVKYFTPLFCCTLPHNGLW